MSTKALQTELNSPLNKPINRIDIAEALKLRYKNNHTFQEIADHFGVTKGAVHKALASFINILKSPEDLEAYRKQKSDLLDSVELELMSQMVDKDKIKAASLNNVAYAMQNVFNMNRLEKDLSTANIATALTFEVVEHSDNDDVIDITPGQSEGS